MAIARKIAYNVIFNIITKILSTVLALVGIGFIMQYLGKDGFGDYSTVLAFFAFFGSAADLGLYSITAREISRPDADEKKIIGNALGLRLVSSLFVFSIAPIFIHFLPYSSEIKLGIMIAAASFVFSTTYMVLNGLFQKNLAMDKVSSAEIIGKIFQILIIVTAVKLDLGFIAIVSSVLASMILNFLIIFFLARKYVALSFRFDFPYWKRFLIQSLPLGFSSLIVFIYFKIDTIILSILKNPSDVGIYNAAYKVLENITFFPAMIIGLVFPLLSKYIFSDKEKFSQIANETLKVFVILIVPLVIGTLFLANGVIILIGGAVFNEAANILRILIFSLVFIFFGNLFNNILIVSNNQKKLIIPLILCAVFNITSNWLFIPLYSYKAAAINSVFTEFFVAISGLFLVLKYVKFVPRVKNLSRIFLSGLMMGIFLYLFRSASLVFLIFASSMTYLIFLLITKTITAKDISSIIATK
ncbi:MAG: flippase [Candidatus Moranbacteria bacterium]|nr:flippase [Candidatus Moranbacteria bacterium]